MPDLRKTYEKFEWNNLVREDLTNMFQTNDVIDLDKELQIENFKIIQFLHLVCASSLINENIWY